jgi:rhodanese-related sulfurtransferase
MVDADRSAVSRLLEESRAGLRRVQPEELETVRAAGALVVDIRPVEQRRRDGELPGAVVVDRNVLEWRLDPTSGFEIPAAREGRRVVLVCNEGYASSLAAATLQDLGLTGATDLAGGYRAWREHVGADGVPPSPPA